MYPDGQKVWLEGRVEGQKNMDPSQDRALTLQGRLRLECFEGHILVLNTQLLVELGRSSDRRFQPCRHSGSIDSFELRLQSVGCIKPELTCSG